MSLEEIKQKDLVKYTCQAIGKTDFVQPTPRV